MPNDLCDFARLKLCLQTIPSVRPPIGCGNNDIGVWWVKFALCIENSLAWNVVQELGHVLNYISIEERLPTVFKPTSPPPYLNGGPSEFLSWVIECADGKFTPDDVAALLEGRLPRAVNDLNEWSIR